MWKVAFESKKMRKKLLNDVVKQALKQYLLDGKRNANVKAADHCSSNTCTPKLQFKRKVVQMDLSLSNKLAGIVPCNYCFDSFMNYRRQDSFVVVLTKGSINCR